MKTPDEARQCWCPYARVETGQLEAMSSALAAVNRGFKLLKRAFGRDDPKYTWDQDQAYNCIAEECMAWRWVVSDPYEDDQGYCGLAGKP